MLHGNGFISSTNVRMKQENRRFSHITLWIFFKRLKTYPPPCMVTTKRPLSFPPSQGPEKGLLITPLQFPPPPGGPQGGAKKPFKLVLMKMGKKRGMIFEIIVFTYRVGLKINFLGKKFPCLLPRKQGFGWHSIK